MRPSRNRLIKQPARWRPAFKKTGEDSDEEPCMEEPQERGWVHPTRLPAVIIRGDQTNEEEIVRSQQQLTVSLLEGLEPITSVSQSVSQSAQSAQRER
jgi:hypothetical protein